MPLDKLMGDRQIEKLYGACPDEKWDNTIWVTLLNIGGLPFYNVSPKNKEIWTLICNNQVDILGIAKVHVNWKTSYLCTGSKNVP